MAKQWVTISASDLKEAEVYSYEPHNAGALKGIPYAVCKKCGLVYLHNDITKLCIKLGCNHTLHQEYKKWCFQKK